MRRDHRQVGEAPLAALDVEFLRGLDLDQVAHGAGHDVGVVLEMLVMFVELAGHRREGPDDVLGHRRLFCDYQSLCHLRALYTLRLPRAHARTRMCAYST
ncbi:hypothetical protein D3C72_1967270 [compost metagenome]